MDKRFGDQVVTELVKHGWEVDPRDNIRVFIARKAVKTFRGTDFAKIHPVIIFEGGGASVKAEFISKGENALALCVAFFKTEGEIPSKIAVFHEEVMKSLSQAFSVRMAT